MAWVRGIREVRHVTVAIDSEVLGLRRGPVMTRNVRQKIDLTPGSWPYVLQAVADLPRSSGAGPCGTLARCPYRTRMLWSVVHLIHPLQAYYAAYVPPMRFGAKPGPRGRRAA